MARSYVTSLRKGRIENPGYEKMLAIARVMEFPPALWFEEVPWDGTQAAPAEGQDLGGRVRHLFQTIRHPKIGEPHASAEAARMSMDVLMEEEVESIRTGAILDPTVGQAAALTAVFSVPTSYLVDREEPSPLDAELLQGLSDETASTKLRETAPL